MFGAGMRAWPPRLPDQPIFYPVLNRAYGQQIASRWNTAAPGRVGYVTEFEVDDAVAARWPRQVVGASVHEELWVPAEALPEFNAALVGLIRVVDAFYGEGFTGLVPETGPLAGLDAVAQRAVVVADPEAAVAECPVPVFLHYPLWVRMGAGEWQDDLRAAWGERHRHIALLEVGDAG